MGQWRACARASRRNRGHILIIDPGSSLLPCNGATSANAELARALLAVIPGIDPGSSVLTSNGSTSTNTARARLAEIPGRNFGRSVLL